MCTAVNLLPESEVVVGPTVKFAPEGDASYPMKHKVRALEGGRVSRNGWKARWGVSGKRDPLRDNTS